MGSFTSRQWKDVLELEVESSESKKSKLLCNSDPSDTPLLQERLKFHERILGNDPRSISDDVKRTPIQVTTPDTSVINQSGIQSAEEPRTNPTFSLMDPRSPTVDPRTPILVQQKGIIDDENEMPLCSNVVRGATSVTRNDAFSIAPSRLIFSSVDTPSSSTKTTTVVHSLPFKPINQKTLIEADCRSPLLIENMTTEEVKHIRPSSTTAVFSGDVIRIPLGSLDMNSTPTSMKNPYKGGLDDASVISNDVFEDSPNSDNSLLI